MKNLLVVLTLLSFAACVPDRKSEIVSTIHADSIIPEAQMILMLADAHVIEAALVIARNRGINTKEQGNYYYTGLFSKYGVSRERYQQNIDFYRSNPELFIHLYEEVNKELIAREKNFVKEIPN
ncbi:MAG: DUF4296 domain-containing protein [Bacteroidales bacterium]|nr:DUF4296 domain-containing protein [Bacteroidales bacterium]